jgi:CheY-like chemotaxis protein
LPLSRRLAGLLGGELWCESELGKGSTFYLSVPVELPGTHLPSAQRKNVLIVDDDETFRYVLQQILAESQAYNVVETNDGEAGLKSIRALHPDLVILDLQMPGKDGFAVMRELREDPATAQQRVLVCTSLPLNQDTLARLPPGIPILPKHAISRDKVRSLLNSAFSQTQS